MLDHPRRGTCPEKMIWGRSKHRTIPVTRFPACECGPTLHQPRHGGRSVSDSPLRISENVPFAHLSLWSCTARSSCGTAFEFPMSRGPFQGFRVRSIRFPGSSSQAEHSHHDCSLQRRACSLQLAEVAQRSHYLYARRDPK